ncbi:hypothetical protein FRC06_005131 [Ceratobasidium sp. 370]|nr:hypothetical protein FRC06_005131 [Ceratobasidium sp. 370]
MARLSFVRCVYALAALSTCASGAVTVYRVDEDKNAHLTATSTAESATYTGSAAYDPTVLNPPPPPGNLNRDFTIQLPQGGLPGLSIPQKGSYLGFSIELSVATRVVGTNSSILSVPFLNHIANVANRGGAVRVRIGGNTQETAILRQEGFPDGRILVKTGSADTTTITPHVEFAPDLQTLGDNLQGMALGNEPDLYDRPGHNKRPEPYTFDEYMSEWGGIANALAANPGYTNKQMLMGPSTCCASSNSDWTNMQLANAGYLERFANELKVVTIQRYPNNNCGTGEIRIPQEIFVNFLSHQLLSQHASEYTEFSRVVQNAGKPLYMLETNTGACGGFPGISDSFGAGLWAVDWALKLATQNFSTTLLHVGGQGDYYNPFTPPPTNQSTFRQWTTGSVYYSTLIVAELFGKSGNARIVDLNANNGENLTPGYVVYENGAPTRVLLINYIDDATGGHDVTARIAVQGNAPQQVRVKYFSAPSVSFKGNMTWAGQTLGNHFESDGRLKNEEVVQTITCENGACAIPLKAPSLALVFLSDQALRESSPDPSATQTFPTTFLTKLRHTATIDQAVLATSNGRGGARGNKLGSTSLGSVSGAGVSAVMPGLGMLGVLVAGAVLAGLGRW